MILLFECHQALRSQATDRGKRIKRNPDRKRPLFGQLLESFSISSHSSLCLSINCKPCLPTCIHSYMAGYGDAHGMRRFFYRLGAFFTRPKFYAFKRISTVSSMQVGLAGITKDASMANADYTGTKRHGSKANARLKAKRSMGNTHIPCLTFKSSYSDKCYQCYVYV